MHMAAMAYEERHQKKRRVDLVDLCRQVASVDDIEETVLESTEPVTEPMMEPTVRSDDTPIFSTKDWKVTVCETTHKTDGGALDLPPLGPRIETCKGRIVIVAITDARLRDAFDEAKAHVKGLIVTTHCDRSWVLVFKDKHRDFHVKGFETFAISKQMLGHDIILRFIRAFSSVAHVGNLVVRETKNTGANEIPDFEVCCEMLRDTKADHATWRRLRADALKHRAQRVTTPMENGILTYTANLKEWFLAREGGEVMMYELSTPTPHSVENFKDDILNLRGVHFEEDGGVQGITIRELMWPETGVPLYYHKTIIFVGEVVGGKSELVHALAREFCRRNGKEKYGFSRRIDPYGLLTKSGRIKDMGCYVFDDFELKHKTGSLLSQAEQRQFLLVERRAHVGARYHQAVFPESVPRVWAVNRGVDVDTNKSDYGEWFDRNFIEGLARLVREDDEWLQSKATSPHDKTVASRAVIFCIDR